MTRKSLFLMVPLAFTIACGGSDGGTGGPPPQMTLTTSGTVNVTGISISGEFMVSGNFVKLGYSLQPSCAAYATEGNSAEDLGEEGAFDIPGPVIGVPLEPTGDVYGSTLRIPAVEYAGPGTYVNDDTVVQVRGQIILFEIPGGATYYLEDGSTTAIIMADGSGSLAFDDIPDAGGGGSTASGTLSWTCTDPE